MSVINEPVLVLNRVWMPISFLPVSTAITTVMRDMASILEPKDYLLYSFEEWIEASPASDLYIQTPNMKIPAPEVIILKKYGERPPRKVSFTRPNLYKRDSYTCQYCGNEMPNSKLTIEHIMPRSRGGPTSWENCVAACGDCNARKADQTPPEAGMKLRTKPERPTWVPKLQLPRGKMIRPSWKPFLEKEAVA